MQRHERHYGAMIGGTDENVIKLAQECDVDVANFNCPGQTVVSGTEEGVAKAVAGAKAAGCKIAKSSMWRAPTIPV